MSDYYVHQTVSAFLSVILCLESIVKFQVSLSFVKLKIYKFPGVIVKEFGCKQDGI